jgi:hypothetical protein
LIPLARALQGAGHEVCWAVAAEAAPLLRRHGFDVRPAGIGLAERASQFSERFPEVFALPPRERRRVMFAGLFGWISAPRMLADLRPIADDFMPDLVIHDIAELAAAPLSVSRVIPHVSVAFSGALPDAAVEAAVPSLEDVWGTFGLAVASDLGLFDHAYLHPFPPSLGQRPDDASVHSMRPLHEDGADLEPEPRWLEGVGEARPHRGWNTASPGLGDQARGFFFAAPPAATVARGAGGGEGDELV